MGFQVIDDLDRATQLDSAGLLWWCNPDGGSPWQTDADPWMEGHLGAEGWAYLKGEGFLFAILLED